MFEPRNVVLNKKGLCNCISTSAFVIALYCTDSPCKNRYAKKRVRWRHTGIFSYPNFMEYMPYFRCACAATNRTLHMRSVGDEEKSRRTSLTGRVPGGVFQGACLRGVLKGASSHGMRAFLPTAVFEPKIARFQPPLLKE